MGLRSERNPIIHGNPITEDVYSQIVTECQLNHTPVLQPKLKELWEEKIRPTGN